MYMYLSISVSMDIDQYQSIQIHVHVSVYFSNMDQEKDSVLRQVEELREHALLLTPEITPVSEHYLRMMLCIVDWQRTTD
jgi:hypothetical protein